MRAVRFHGLGKGPVEGELRVPLYLAHDRELAEAYAEPDGDVVAVEDHAVRPLVLDTPEKFVQAWEASGAHLVAGNFHPNQTGAFARWWAAWGYDAIDIPEAAFEGDLGFEYVAGTVGEPQTIILVPGRARLAEVQRVADN